MKKFLLVTVAIMIASPTLAADMRAPVRKAPVVVPAAVYNWTGCYIGGHVGGLWEDTDIVSDLTNDAVFVINQSSDSSSVVGGGHIGCNFQSGQFVFGIEGDASWLNISRETTIDTVGLDEFYRFKSDWVSTIRGRLGLAFNRTLIYATGGVAFSNFKVEYLNYTDSTRTVLEEQEGKRARTGWVVGGGIEYALTDNWLLRGEYLYYQFDTTRFVTQSYLPGGTFADFDTSFHVGRVGLTYKFGGPVVARY